MKKLIILILVVIHPVLLFGGGLTDDAKQILKNRYKQTSVFILSDHVNPKKVKTYFVIKRPGICAAAKNTNGLDNSVVTIDRGIITDASTCSVQLDPGVLFAITYLRMTNDYIAFWGDTLEHVEVTRGIGAFKDRYSERVKFTIIFRFTEQQMMTNDPKELIEAIEHWFQPFDTELEAITFSLQTKSAAARKDVVEIEAGMDISEVEKLLGLPEKKATLSNKVIYRYPDMTIEFIDGKVSDVRF